MPSIGELRAELSAMTGVEPTGKYDTLAADLPLLHRCNDPARLLEAPHLTAGKGSQHREDLGVGGVCTFFWVGRCAYPPTPLVLIWAPGAEGIPPDGYGAPWDTGGLLTKGTLRFSLTLEEARTVIEKYSLPLSDYRAYLSLVIEACFYEPSDYLSDGSRPLRWYPGCRPPPVPEAAPPARTFEVRRSGPVQLAWELVAVVPDESAFVENARLLRKLEKHFRQIGAEWVKPAPGERPYVVATRFVAEFLRKRGVR